MRIRKILLHNPSVTASPCHLPLHKGGFGAVLLAKKHTFQLKTALITVREIIYHKSKEESL